jgi:hypothetical protein
MDAAASRPHDRVISVDFMARAVASGSVRQAAERMRGFITSWRIL